MSFLSRTLSSTAKTWNGDSAIATAIGEKKRERVFCVMEEDAIRKKQEW